MASFKLGKILNSGITRMTLKNGRPGLSVVQMQRITPTQPKGCFSTEETAENKEDTRQWANFKAQWEKRLADSTQQEKQDKGKDEAVQKDQQKTAKKYARGKDEQRKEQRDASNGDKGQQPDKAQQPAKGQQAERRDRTLSQGASTGEGRPARQRQVREARDAGGAKPAETAGPAKAAAPPAAAATAATGDRGAARERQAPAAERAAETPRAKEYTFIERSTADHQVKAGIKIRVNDDGTTTFFGLRRDDSHTSFKWEKEPVVKVSLDGTDAARVLLLMSTPKHHRVIVTRPQGAVVIEKTQATEEDAGFIRLTMKHTLTELELSLQLSELQEIVLNVLMSESISQSLPNLRRKPTE